MAEELKREIDIRELECPFCGNIQNELISDTLFNEMTGEAMGYGADGWECKKCGAENDTGLENFEADYNIFRQFTDNDDWKGFREFCEQNNYDAFVLSCLAKLYNQQRKFSKAISVAAVMIAVDAREPDSESIIKDALRGIKNKREIK